ncbi:MAG TPA: hypothetical protein VMF91_04095 [Bryobacteraceae bacterium]|nr:hypothetical protein [Bryobacteraceae bacterium]
MPRTDRTGALARPQRQGDQAASLGGTVALPCRVPDPDRKRKLESGVGYAKKTPLKCLRFEGLEEAQAYLDLSEERWADTRIDGTTKRQVAAMFTQNDRLC